MPTYQYRCGHCDALYESERAADEVVCRSPGCPGRATRIRGTVRYTLPTLKDER